MARKIIRKNRKPKNLDVSSNVVQSEEGTFKVDSLGVDKSILDTARELAQIKEHRKRLETREKELKARLEESLVERGAKDSRGSYSLIASIDGQDKLLKKEARKSVRLNAQKAEELFREKGIWDDVIEMKEVINENYVEQAVLNEKLTTEELESITDVKVSYSIIVKDYKVEDSGEVDD